MQTTELYTDHPKGPVVLGFDRGAHRYFATDSRGESIPVPSATAITRMAGDGSDRLVAWAASTAAKQVRCELDRFRPTRSQIEEFQAAIEAGEPLARVLGRGFRFDEVWVEDVVRSCRSAHRRLSDTAKDVGAEVHAFAEQWVRYRLGRRKEPRLPVNEAARNGAQAFLDWLAAHDVTFHFAERKVYSRAAAYAGTADIGMTYEGVKGVGDFKTSKGVYASHHWQTAAYLNALQEELGDDWQGRWIIHLDKRTGGFKVVESPKGFEADYGVFMGLRAVHRGIKGY